MTNSKRVIVVQEESEWILERLKKQKTRPTDCIWVEKKRQNENISKFLAWATEVGKSGEGEILK